MHVWHVTEYCHAAGFGGTERYVLELVRGLETLGWRNTIAWLTSDRTLRPFTLEGVRIIPLGGAGSRVDPPDRSFLPQVGRLLAECFPPDLLHFHTFGRAEAEVAGLAAERGLPYVFTYHTPSLSCRRETLLRWGRTVCDGEVRTLRCSACKLQERLDRSPGFAWTAMLFSLGPAWLVGPLASNRWRRRLAFVRDTSRFRNAWQTFLHQAAAVIACCRWSVPVLQSNGVPAERIRLCPQGVPTAFVEELQRLRLRGPRPPERSPLFEVGYVGRLSAVKGIDILLEAFTSAPYPKARLRVYGWSPDDSGRAYAHRVLQMAARDPRVTFLPRLPFGRLVEEYTRLSLLAIPSVSLETGPFVLLEALQAGVPVWGSTRVGQLDLLRKYGRLIRPNTVDAWRTALEETFRRHARGENPCPSLSPVEPLRTMADVAVEMATCYGQVLGTRAGDAESATAQG